MVMGVVGPLFFSRAFNDWEVELVERFLQKIQVFKVQREGEDSDLDNFEVWHLYGQVSLFYFEARRFSLVP